MAQIKVSDLPIANTIDDEDLVYAVVGSGSRAVPAKLVIGPKGDSLEFDIEGDQVGVRVEGDATFSYTDPLTGPQGDTGPGLEFDIDADRVGVRVEGDAEYIYTDPLTGPAGTTDYDDLTNVPSEFPPEAHGHTIADVTNLQTELDGKAATGHGHTLSDISDSGDLAPRNRASVAQHRSLSGDVGLTAERLGSAADFTSPSGASNWSPDWSDFVSAEWVLSGNRTLNNPSNIVPGTIRVAWVRGDNSTERSISFGSAYKGADGDLPDTPVTSSLGLRLVLEVMPGGDVLVSATEYEL